MPIRYGSPIDEHLHVRSSVGLFDLSHMGRLRVSGPAAAQALGAAVTIDVPAVPVGAARYSLLCDSSGGIIDDLMIYRLAEDEFLVICNASGRAVVPGELAERMDRFDIQFDDESDRTALLAIQGPQAEGVLAQIDESCGGMRRFRVRVAPRFGTGAFVARTGYTGEDGFELVLPAEGIRRVWDELSAIESVRPIGLAARDSLRLEAGLTLYGSDIDLTTNPYEGGLDRFVHLEHDFPGRAALRSVCESGPKRELIGLQLDGRRVARGGEPVLMNGEAVGVITSGVHAPSLDQPVAFARVERGRIDEGSQVTVGIRGTDTPATRVPVPFLARPGMRKSV